MSYESWRISYQSSEQAARAAYSQVESQAREIESLRTSYDAATMLVAQMHEAAVGKVIGPHHGVVEDIKELRAALVEAADAFEIAVKLNSFREFNDHIPAMKVLLTRCKEVLK